MENQSKKHHFVTQAQLRRFAGDEEKKFVYAFQKATGRVFPSSIAKDAGCATNHNKASIGNSDWNFEHLFAGVDGTSATLVNKIIERNSVAWLEHDDRIALADFISTQLVRTQIWRENVLGIGVQIRSLVADLRFDPDNDSSLMLPTEDDVKIQSARAFLQRQEHSAALMRLIPALYSCPTENRFVISDNPVILYNPLPYGELGLRSNGVIVVIPVTPSLALALHCPTLLEKYERASSSRMVPYKGGLTTGSPILIDVELVDYLNKSQVVQSGKYIYSATNDFKAEVEFLDQNEEYRQPTPQSFLGEMGSGPPPKRDMPLGTWLVIHSQNDHGMLAIAQVSEEGEGITVRTSQTDALAELEANPEILRVELYVDQRAVHMIGQAKIERFGMLEVGWFRVVDHDPSLRALGRQLAK